MHCYCNVIHEMDGKQKYLRQPKALSPRCRYLVVPLSPRLGSRRTNVRLRAEQQRLAGSVTFCSGGRCAAGRPSRRSLARSVV